MSEEQVREMYKLARTYCIKKHIWFDDDLIQDLVSCLYDRYNKFDETKGTFSTFAFMCFKNYLYDRKRKNCPEILVENVEELISDDSEDSDRKLIVEEIMGVISDDEILMDWLEGMTPEKIGKKHGKHRTTISRYIKKRIQELKDEYIGG